MLKAEYHQRIEQAMWRRAGDKRVPAWWRLHLRIQARRFRSLASLAKKNEGSDEPTDEIVRQIARQWLCTPAEARKIIIGDGHSSRK